MEKETIPLPYFFISQDVVEKRVANFVENKHSVLTEALGKMDTKNIWYSLDHIEKLLQEIKLVNGDGLRIFFGMYEPTHRFAGQLCLVMNPTRPNAKGGHDNVILENEPDFEKRSTFERSVRFPKGDDPSVVWGYNYGSPCPPSCDDDSTI